MRRFAFLILAHSIGLSTLLTAQDALPTFTLPFQDDNACYFFSHEGALYLGDHAQRTLYRINAEWRCEKVEDMQGWYVADASMFRERVVYCSRDRILYREQGKVQTVPVAGANSLVAITTDGEKLFILEERSDSAEFKVIILDSAFSKKSEFVCPGRRPLDIYWHEGCLWIYDQQDKCVHRLDLSTKQVTARIYTGVGHSWSKGILFFNNILYVQDRAASSLIPVEWRQEGNVVYSCFTEVDLTFSQKTVNTSATAVCRAEFRIPVPESTPDTRVLAFSFSSTPDFKKHDAFGQELAWFKNITIAPGAEHRLEYNAHVVLASPQYTLPEVPLRDLVSIPPEIKSLYLLGDSFIPLDDPGLIAMSKEASLDASGNPPRGIKSLIENLVDYIINRLEYEMDDNWESADKVVAKGKGSCSEYSFLFSALARLQGIPTRLCGGLQSDGNFHRWTEVWYPGTGWVPVDVTKIDSPDIQSRDYEYLFGKVNVEFALSRIGTPDHSDLGVNYYIYRSYSIGQRERTTDVKINSIKPLYPVKEITILPPGGSAGAK